MSLLLRLREVTSGCIALDGIDIRAMPPSALRSAVGMVPQSPFVFSGTVADNVDPLHAHAPGDRLLETYGSVCSVGSVIHFRSLTCWCTCIFAQPSACVACQGSSRQS